MTEFQTALGNSCFRSNCIEEMQLEITRNYCDHSLMINKSKSDLSGNFYKLPLKSMAINYLGYGAEVSIDIGQFQDFYMIEFPLSGSVRLTLDRQEYTSGNGVGSFIPPSSYVKSVWSEDCAQVMLKIDRRTLDSYLQNAVMQDVNSEIAFDPRVSFDSGPGASLYSYLNFLLHQSLSSDSMLGSPLVRSEIEETILAIIIDQFDHSYSDQVRSGRSLIMPHHVAQAYKYIRANAHKDISNEELAQISGVSLRTLYAGFKKFLGVSPQSYLRIYRLEMVKSELESAKSGVMISDVAQKWGFTHMGRFSRDFRNRFGVPPSKVGK